MVSSRKNPAVHGLAAPKRSAEKLDAETLEERGHRSKALGVAGRENHHGAGMARQNALKRLQEHALFFIVDRTTANQDGPGVGVLETFAKIRDQGRRRARLQLEFQIASDFHPRLGRSELGQPRTVLIGLGKEEVDVADNVFKPPAQTHVPADGTVGEASVDDRHRGAAALARAARNSARTPSRQ